MLISRKWIYRCSHHHNAIIPSHGYPRSTKFLGAFYEMMFVTTMGIPLQPLTMRLESKSGIGMQDPSWSQVGNQAVRHSQNGDESPFFRCMILST